MKHCTAARPLRLLPSDPDQQRRVQVQGGCQTASINKSLLDFLQSRIKGWKLDLYPSL